MNKLLNALIFVLFCMPGAYIFASAVIPEEQPRGLAICTMKEPRFRACIKQERIPWEVVGAFMEKTGKRTFEDEEIMMYYEGWKAAQTVKEEK